jgi:methylated-DNA-[protein]-cysteine S-methyltransferase
MVIPVFFCNDASSNCSIALNSSLKSLENIQYYKTKIGKLILGSFDDKLCILDFEYRKMRKIVDSRIKKNLQAEFVERRKYVAV